MAVSNLNVRVGFLFDEKGLKQLERQMRSAGQRLSGLGSQLTTAITVPLGLIGAGAIKAAGDLEALQLAMRATFQGAGRSIAEADAELQKLRQSALAPGLDFEQAVRASVRLQNVGFTAEKAREVIEQLANAVATTGGTAQDLDEVTQQFSQMIGKGKIFQDDLKIIVGRMPLLAGLMKETFGATTAEGLNELGVNAREFVDVMTKKMAELPRVSGGIANSIVNLFSSLKNSAATLGLAMNKAFDITGKLDAFAAIISNIADGFASLNPTIQTVIISMGALFFAVGPVISVFGILKSNTAALIGVWGGIVSGARAVQTWVLNVASAFRALNLATQSFILIGVAIAIATIVTQLGLFNHELTAVEKAQQSVNDLVRESAQAVQQEKTKVGELVKVVEDQNAKYEDRKKAIEALKRISPEYFGQLSLEKTEYGGLTSAVNSYIQSLVDAETVRRAVARKAEIQIEKQNAALDTTTTTWQKVKAAALGFNSAVDAAAQGAAIFNQNVAETKTRLEAEDKALDDVIAKHGGVVNSTQKLASATTGLHGPLEKTSKLSKIYKEVLSDIANVSAQQDLLGSERVIEQAAAIENGIKKLLDAGFKPMSKEVQGLKKDLQGLFSGVEVGADFAPLPTLPTPGAVQSVTPSGTDALVQGLKVATPAMLQFLSVSQQLGQANMAFQGGLVSFGDTFQTVADIVAANGNLMQQSFMGIGMAMQQAAADGASSFGELATAAATAAAKVVRAWIQQGVAAAVAKALGGLPFPFNLAAGAAAGALAGAAFTKALQAIKVPGFAKGTNFAPGGLALVGEAGPELVNLPRGSQVTPNAATNRILSENAGAFTLSHRIQGSDLLFIVERAQAQSKRTRGF